MRRRLEDAVANGAEVEGYDPFDDHEQKKYLREASIRTPAFWLQYLSYFWGCFAGLMITGHIAAHGRGSGLDALSASYAVSSLAIANAVVRILIGAIAAKLGTRKCFIGVFALQVVAILLLYPAGSNVLFLCINAILIGWNYGAMFTLFPATCLAYFGPTAQGFSYGLMFTAGGLAGFTGPWVGGWFKDSSVTYYTPFIVSAVVVAMSVFISATSKPPVKQT